MTAFQNALDPSALGTTRAAAVDSIIASSRHLTPVAPELTVRRTRDRLTVQEINRLNDEAISMGMLPSSIGDTRTATERFLDLIDLPRNAMLNIAVGDPSAEQVLGGIGATAAWGAGIGSLTGSMLGPAGSLAGAAGGALIAGGGTAAAYGLGAVLRPMLASEATRRSLVSRNRKGTFGAPSIYASDVLAEMGVESPVARAVLGFGGDVLLDPTTWLSGGGSVIAKTGTGGAKIVLNKGGGRLLRDYGEFVARTGQLPTDPTLSKLNNLFETTVRVGDTAWDVTGPHGQLQAQREAIRSYMEQVAKAVDPAEKAALSRDLAVAQRTLKRTLDREIVDLATVDPTAGPVEAFRSKVSRDFLRDYAARSTHQVAVPFGSFIAARLPGYRSGNLPIGGFGEPGRLAKFLGGSEDEFLARTRGSLADELRTLREARSRMVGGRRLTLPQAASTLADMPEDIRDLATIDDSGQWSVPMASIKLDRAESLVGAGWSMTDPNIPQFDLRTTERLIDLRSPNRRRAKIRDLSTRLADVMKRHEAAGTDLDEAKRRLDISAALSGEGEIDRWQAELTSTAKAREALEAELRPYEEIPRLSIEGSLDDMHNSFREGDVATATVGPLAAISRATDRLFGRWSTREFKELDIQASSIRQQRQYAARIFAIHEDRLRRRYADLERFAGENVLGRVAEERTSIGESLGAVEDALSEVDAFGKSLPSAQTIRPPPKYVAPPRPPAGADASTKAAYKAQVAAARAAHKDARRAWKKSGKVEHFQPVELPDVPPWLSKEDRVVDGPSGKVTVVRHDATIPRMDAENPVPGRVSNAGDRTSFDLRFESPIDRALYEAARAVRAGDRDAAERASAARRWVARNLGVSEGAATRAGRKLIADVERQVFGFSPTWDPPVRQLKLDENRRVFAYQGKLLTRKELMAQQDILAPIEARMMPELLEPTDYVTLRPWMMKEAKYRFDESGWPTSMVGVKSPGEAAGHAPGNRHLTVPMSQVAADRHRIADEGMKFTYREKQAASLYPWEMTRRSMRNLERLRRMGGIASEHASDVAGIERSHHDVAMDLVRTDLAKREANHAADAALAPLNERMNEIEASTPYRFQKWLRGTMNQTRTGLALNANLRYHEIARRWRMANEEQLNAVKQREMRWLTTAMKELAKDTGADPEHLHDAVMARFMAIALAGDERSVVGFLPDDPFIAVNARRLADEAPRLLGDPQVDRLAAELQRRYNDFLQIETHLGVLPDDVPSVAYINLLMDERMKRAMFDSMRRIGESGRRSHGRMTANPNFAIRRSTNRMLYGSRHEDLILKLALRDRNGPLPPDIVDDIARADIGPEDWIFTGKLWDMTPGVVSGPGAHPFEAWRLSFLRRMLDRGIDLTTAGDRHVLGLPGGDPGVPGWMPQEFPTSPAMLNARRDLFRDMGADMVTGDLFSEDIVQMFAARSGQHLKARAMAKFVEEVVPFIRPVDAETAATLPRGSGAGTVSMNGIEYRRIDQKILKDDRLHLFTNIPKQMLDERMYWPVAMADDVEDVARKLSSEADLTGALRGVQSVQSVWKQMQLFASPSWWTGNLVSGLFMSWLIGGSRPTHWPRMSMLATGLVHDIHTGKRRMDAAKYVLNGEEWSGREIKEMLISGGLVSAGRTAIEIGNVLRTGAEKSGRFQRLLRNGPLGRFYGMWFGFNAQTDDVARAMTALDLLDQGHSFEHAIDRARVAHVDFGDLSHVEAKYGTLIWPFYRWMAGNLKLQLRHAMERPAYATMFPKLREALNEGFDAQESIPLELQPDWLKDNIAVQLSENPHLRYAMLKTLTPAQELFEAMAGTMGWDGMWEFMTYAAGTTNPVVRFPFEIATRREINSGRDIGDEPGAVPWADYWTNQIGVYRRGAKAYDTLSKDDVDPIGETAKLLLGGSRVQTMTPEQVVARYGFEARNTTESLRRRIKAAKRAGDDGEARRLSAEMVDVNRRLWRLGYADMVPRTMRSRFRDEERRRLAADAAR